MKKIIAIGLAALSLTGAAYAFGGFGNHEKGFMSQNTNVQSAIENNDYDAFVEAASEVDSNAVDRIDEERFALMVDKHENREAMDAALDAEDYETFKEIMNERCERRMDQMTEEKFQEMVDVKQAHDAVKSSIESEDYDAWVSAVSSLPHGSGMADVVSEEDFEIMIEVHDLRESGDHEAARALAKENDLKPMRLGEGRGDGMKQGFGQGQGRQDGSGKGMGQGRQGSGQGQRMGMHKGGMQGMHK